MILGIRTDQPEACLSLLDDSGTVLAEHSWLAGRRLSQELLPAIQGLLQQHDVSWSDLTGVVVYEGPGSFTGLRIGATTANTLGYALSIPVVAIAADDWPAQATKRLEAVEPGTLARPVYGAEPNVVGKFNALKHEA